MRTQEEIIARIESIKKDDFFGFQTADLIQCLDFEHAKSYLKKGATADQWPTEPHDRESILKVMENYMDFAWDKANNERGLSAGRSMAHYTAWTWLIGDEDKFPNLETYTDYGRPHLRALCKEYGWDASPWDK